MDRDEAARLIAPWRDALATLFDFVRPSGGQTATSLAIIRLVQILLVSDTAKAASEWEARIRTEERAKVLQESAEAIPPADRNHPCQCQGFLMAKAAEARKAKEG